MNKWQETLSVSPEIRCLVSLNSFCILDVTNKIPLGLYEFVKKGDPPVVGITKLDGITMEELKRPRRKVPLGSVPTGSMVSVSATQPTQPTPEG
jgi:hypothetical protein